MLLFTRSELLLLGQKPELAAGAAQFTAMLSLGLPMTLGFQVLRNFSTALNRPNSASWVMAVAIFFNGFADYALIFGHFGMPRLGLVGSGIASASSYTFSFLAMLLVVYLTPTFGAIASSAAFSAPTGTSSSKFSGWACPSA